VTGLTKRKAKNLPDLAAKALHPNQEPILRVSADPDEQDGFFLLVRGAFAVLRNDSHHGLSDKLSRWDALRICCFVDYLLTAIGEAVKRPDPA
jgi:hypothetical protein